MNVKITPFDACGTVSAPPSKSFAHRLIIAALLSGGDCFIENVGDSEDVKATVYAVSALGAEVNYDGKNVYVGKVSVPSFATVDCVESGSALRFFIPVAAALGVHCGTVLNVVWNQERKAAGFDEPDDFDTDRGIRVA
ncbi:MAG: hypothetical protein J6W87_04030, partial [Clostridia bacterium]|nr:hypothetical protein [Clostridia bacterium]